MYPHVTLYVVAIRSPVDVVMREHPVERLINLVAQIQDCVKALIQINRRLLLQIQAITPSSL